MCPPTSAFPQGKRLEIRSASGSASPGPLGSLRAWGLAAYSSRLSFQRNLIWGQLNVLGAPSTLTSISALQTQRESARWVLRGTCGLSVTSGAAVDTDAVRRRGRAWGEVHSRAVPRAGAPLPVRPSPGSEASKRERGPISL